MFSFFNKILPSTFFVVAAFILGIAYSCFRPPFQSPDDFNHFLRAYQISEGHFLPEKKDNRLGGELPVCLSEFKSLYMPMTFIPSYRTQKKDFIEGFDIAFSAERREFMDFPNTSYYSPVSYVPQALALFILRQFNCSVGTLYHGSKIFTYLFWIFSMFLVIRWIPLYKWLCVLLFLMPMSVYIANSYSADVVTNILTLLLIALVLKHAFVEKKITKKDLIIFLGFGILLALTKIVYAALLLLLFIIPASRFGSQIRKFTALGSIILFSFVVVQLWSATIMKYYITFEEYDINHRVFATIHTEANYYKQKEHLMQNKLHFFKVMYNSIFEDSDFYVRSYVGRFGTYMDTPVPVWFYLSYFVTIIFVAITEENKITLSWKKKIILFSAAFIAYALLILSQHLTWNKIGNDIVDSFQGRYLIPIFPLLFMLFSNSWNKIKFNPALIVIIIVFFTNAYACNQLYNRYFQEIYVSKVDFTCDLEELDAKNNFITSDPKITLSGGDKRTAREHRSGKYAIMLPPDSSFAGTYHFKNLKLGDLIEIYAWQKDGNAEIVVEGKGQNCNPYHFINKDIQLTDKNGWKKMQQIFSMFVHCDTSEVNFFLQNPKGDTTYFDDLRYSVKTFE